MYVSSMVDAVNVKRSRVNHDSSRRDTTLKYHLKVGGVRKPVCKSMFLATTSLGSWSVQQWAKSTEEDQPPVDQDQGTRTPRPYYNRAAADKVFMREEFLEKLNKMQSHYCRKSTSKLYLDRTIQSYNELYRLYCGKCAEHGRRPLSRMLLMQEFHAMNLALFRPRKDQCDTCVAHDNKLIADDVYVEHRLKKTGSRGKRKGQRHCGGVCKGRLCGSENLVTTMDLQAVLLAPTLQASALYYKQKLAVHNFVIYDLATHDTQ